MRRRLRILNGICKSIAIAAFILGIGVFSAWEQGTITLLQMAANAIVFFSTSLVFYRLKPGKLLRRYLSAPAAKNQKPVVHVHTAA
ncbi:MAG: hypothetical protein PHG02_03920 [Oscillospiraceae bacterium]|nr:hypothetical protein [Oscillospiraceae bacterium]